MNQGVNILMYHSISAGEGPTCICPAVFLEQMQVLAECGYRGVSLAEALPALRGQGDLPARSVVLTFDDGYEDFATTAFPELQARGWSATVFLPVGKLGQRADWATGWDGRNRPRLMDWESVGELARQGVDFGGHGVSHTDLTTLPADTAGEEIARPKRVIENRTGRPVVSYAPPFGKSTPALRDRIKEHYQASAGVRLNLACTGRDLFDLPRIEMWYFRNSRRWRAYLRGGAKGYFLLRRLLRKVRCLVK